LLGDVEVVRLSQVLRNCKALSTVSLWFNQVGDLGARTLVHSLASAHDSPAIRTLSLGCNPVTDKGVLAVCASLVEHKVPLNSLDLSFCDISSDAAPGIVSLLRGDTATLRSLALVNTPLGDSGVLRLASVLVANTTLEHLDLSGTGMTHVGVGGLAMAIGSGCTSLRSLSLERNSIDAEGATNFATTALRVSTSLHVLSLAYNTIGNDGVAAIARAVGARNVLQSLNVGKNKITAEGAQQLATNLQDCTSLFDLSLFGNRVGATGARAIGALIARPKSTLQFVSLFTCNLGDSGAAALAEMLENVSLPVLVDLDLRFNRIAEDGAIALAAAIEANTDNLNLMRAANGGKLHVGYNPIPDETRSRIGRALGHSESPGFTRREKKPRLGPTRMALTRHSIRFDVKPVAARRSPSPVAAAAAAGAAASSSSSSSSSSSAATSTSPPTSTSPNTPPPLGLGRLSRFFVGPLSRSPGDEQEFEAGDGAATPRPTSGEDSDGGPMARSRTLGSAAWKGIKGRSDSMSGSFIRRRPRPPRKPDSAPRSAASTPRGPPESDTDVSPRSGTSSRSRFRSLLSGSGSTPDSSMRRESK
jgi:Ran GTPase-activating protein (RanGAP) involved in mRNA processing and transport